MSSEHPKGNGIGLEFLIAVAAIIVIMAGLQASRAILAPFLLAVFFAMILMPPLQWLKKKGLSDWCALLALSGIVSAFGLAVILIVSSSLAGFAGKLPDYRTKITAGISKFDEWSNAMMDKLDVVEESLPRFSLPVETPEKETEKAPKQMEEPANETGEDSSTATVDGDVSSAAPPSEKTRFSLKDVIHVDSLLGYAQLAVTESLNTATVGFLVAVMVIFMLIEAARMPEKVREAFNGRDLTNEYFNKIAEDTWNYTKIKTMASALTGIATAIGLWFLGIEYALLWGLLMFFLNYIPNIGQVIASVPPVLIALIDQGVTMAVIVTIWLVVVNTAFGYGFEPRYLGEGLGISSLIVLLSLIFWGWILGPIGMFLSAPLTMVVKIVLQNDPRTRWIATLLKN